MRSMLFAAVWLSLLTSLSAANPFLPALRASHGAAALDDHGGDQPEKKDPAAQSDVKIFTGKIVSMNGELFILRDDINQVWYHLDDQSAAAKFAGKNVQVTGKLNAATDVIHVQSIEEQKP